ncbi:MAG: ABC transporter ATP-binding protein [Hyphomicrobiales bacterium]|nr:MAG: ABC transporter ATP-binding protein [Hyphomicrobiales bacterium]
MAELQLKQVRKSFQNLEVIHGIDLTVENGSFTVFVGPSGCGKSTLLRMISGLEETSAGEIWLDGARCDHLLPSARGMAMVFQSYALYPHMSVEENLRFGLENQRTPEPEIKERVAKAADILQIKHLLKRRPNQLSGGQSQRVAIGRAIVKEPKVFLFDEPLSNLDAELRVKMRSEISQLHDRLGATMIYVTHDQVEAMTMADRIVVMREGIIEQTGSPVELYARPRNQFVAGFLGAPQMNFLKGRVVEAGDRLVIELDGSGPRISLSARQGNAGVGDAVTIGVRPEHLTLSAAGPLAAEITSTEILGAETVLHAGIADGTAITATRRGILGARAGEAVRFDFADAFTHVFDKSGLTLQSQRPWQDDYLSHLT